MKISNSSKGSIPYLLLLLSGCVFLCSGCFGSPQAQEDLFQAMYQKSEDAENPHWQTRNLEPNYLALARDLIDKRYYKVALGQLEKAAEKHPKEPEIYHLMGVCFREQGKHQTAVKCFSRAIALDDEFYPAYNGVGVTFSLQGKSEKAREFFHQAIKLNPARADFYNNLGYSLMCDGQFREAEQQFLQSLALNGGSRLAMNNLAFCRGLTGRERQAIELFSKAGTQAEAYNNMGTVYQMKGETEKAVVMFKKAIELNPRLDRAQKNLALMLNQRSEKRKNVNDNENP